MNAWLQFDPIPNGYILKLWKIREILPDNTPLTNKLFVFRMNGVFRITSAVTNKTIKLQCSEEELFEALPTYAALLMMG